MAITMQDAIRQNTVGNSEGFPVGVPTYYDWYTGAKQLTAAAPRDFTAVTAWGQVYQEKGQSAYYGGSVQVANAKTYVHLRTTGEWVLVQNQATNPISGGHYVADFSGNSSMNMQVNSSNGVATFRAPPANYNDHFWPTSRGTFPANAVDAVYVQMDMRVTDPNLHLIANIGADWWRSSSAGYVDGFANNPLAGMNNWVDLSTDWKTLGYYSSSSVFQGDPPPGIGGGDVGPTPPPPQPTDPVNLLVNGSFEANSVGSGTARNYSSISGWTALASGGIELWNNHDGARATAGNNFGKLDPTRSQDGLYQTVKTQAGQRYSLSFDARIQPGAYQGTSTIEVLWNNSVVGRVPPGGNWNNYSFSVTGTGGNDRLTFRETGLTGDRWGALYDNVKLVAAGSTTTSTQLMASADQGLATLTEGSVTQDAGSAGGANKTLAGEAIAPVPTKTAAFAGSEGTAPAPTKTAEFAGAGGTAPALTKTAALAGGEGAAPAPNTPAFAGTEGTAPVPAPTKTAALSPADKAVALMTQYSAAVPDTSSIAATPAFQGTSQETLAPTLAQTNQSGTLASHA